MPLSLKVFCPQRSCVGSPLKDKETFCLERFLKWFLSPVINFGKPKWNGPGNLRIKYRTNPENENPDVVPVQSASRGHLAASCWLTKAYNVTWI